MKGSTRSVRTALSSLLFIVPVIAVAVAPAQAVTATDWPSYMYGPDHHSDNVADTAITPANVGTLTQQWHMSGSGFLSSPVVADGYVFIGSTSGEFYELNATTGAVVAQAFLGTQPHITCPAEGFVSTAAVAPDPTTSADMVYVSNPRGYLLAMSIPSLAVKWRQVIAVPSKTTNNYFDWSSPTVANGKVYVGISSNCDHPLVRGGVRSYDQATGTVLGTFYSVPSGQTGGSVWTSVAVDDSGDVYAATGNTSPTKPYYGISIVKLSPVKLFVLGHFTVPAAERTKDNDFGGSPTIFGSDVGACNHNGVYYAAVRSTMAEAWERTIGKHVGGPVQAQCAAGAVYDGTHLFIGGDSTTIGGHAFAGSIRELSPSNGAFLWQTGLPDGVIGAPTMNGGGTLAVATYDVTSPSKNGVYLLNASNGNVVRMLLPGDMDFAQATFANGWLFAANFTGVYGFKLP